MYPKTENKAVGRCYNFLQGLSPEREIALILTVIFVIPSTVLVTAVLALLANRFDWDDYTKIASYAGSSGAVAYKGAKRILKRGRPQFKQLLAHIQERI